METIPVNMAFLVVLNQTGIIWGWVLSHWVELVGALAGMVYIFLEIRQNAWLWPVGIVTALFYILVFFQAKFYADMSLQVYYVAISIYGWHQWTKGKFVQDKIQLPVRKTGWQLGILLFLVSLAIYWVIAFILVRYTDSPVPYGDAFTTALSIVGTWMLAKKLIEHWYVWVIVNMVSVGLYIFKELYPTTILYLVYLIMAIIGYFVWRKSGVKGTVKIW